MSSIARGASAPSSIYGPDGRNRNLVEVLTDTGDLPPNLLSLKDFQRSQIERCIDIAAIIETADPRECCDVARGRVAAILWYQQSFRTRLGFETAMLRLGGAVTGFSDPASSRSGGWYSESIEDVVRFGGAIVDLVVMRHYKTGEVGRIASVSPVPVLNGGDGFGEHPSQALGDIYHLHKAMGSLDGLRMGIIGSLNWRAMRSLAIGLSKFKVELLLLPPPGQPDVPADVAEVFEDSGISVKTVEDVSELLAGSDAVTTLGAAQSEFGKPTSDNEKARPTPASHRITLDGLRKTGREIVVMHVAPITDEIDREIDGTPYAHYFAEARDGMWMRMAMMGSLLRRGTGREGVAQ